MSRTQQLPRSSMFFFITGRDVYHIARYIQTSDKKWVALCGASDLRTSLALTTEPPEHLHRCALCEKSPRNLLSPRVWSYDHPLYTYHRLGVPKMCYGIVTGSYSWWKWEAYFRATSRSGSESSLEEAKKAVERAVPALVSGKFEYESSIDTFQS